MAESRFDHGELPARARPFLVCPNVAKGHGETRTVEVVEGSGYRAKFKCRDTSCRLEFTVSDAQLRRVVP